MKEQVIHHKIDDFKILKLGEVLYLIRFPSVVGDYHFLADGEIHSLIIR